MLSSAEERRQQPPLSVHIKEQKSRFFQPFKKSKHQDLFSEMKKIVPFGCTVLSHKLESFALKDGEELNCNKATVSHVV